MNVQVEASTPPYAVASPKYTEGVGQGLRGYRRRPTARSISRSARRFNVDWRFSCSRLPCLRARVPPWPGRARSTPASERAPGSVLSAARSAARSPCGEAAVSVTQRVVAALLPLLVRRDVHLLEPELAALAARVRLGDRRPALPQRLDLRTGQDDARLEALLDVIVVTRAAVAGDGLLSSGCGLMVRLRRRGSDACRSSRRSPR